MYSIKHLNDGDMNQIEELIYFFTHNKNLTQKQRAKRDELLARDVVKPKTPVFTSQSDKPKGHRPGLKLSYISPKQLKQFLLDFNQDEILKYTCHLIDNDEAIKQICSETQCPNYIFEEHSKLIVARFNTLKKRYNWPNYKIVSQINAYFTGVIGGKITRWSSNEIGDNWNDVNIRRWAKENPGIVPNPGSNIARKQKNNGYTLPKAFIANHTGKRIFRFSDLVLFFKSQFHLRRDNSLRNIIKHITCNRNDIEIYFSEDRFYDNIELFTDVDKLVQAFNRIIDVCVENSEKDIKPKIEISFFNDELFTFFVIHHMNTEYGKSLKDVLERIGEQHSALIKNQVNGLCDLYLEANFGQGNYARINLWDEKEKMESQKIEKIEGVKYILRFY